MRACTCSKMPNKTFQSIIPSLIRYIGPTAELER